MKVISVSNYQNYCSVVPYEKQKSQHKNVTFKGGWDLRVLERSENEIKEMAKKFCKSSDAELIEATSEYYGVFIKKKNKSLANYYRLKPEVDKVKEEVSKKESTLRALESKSYKTTKDEQEIASLKNQLAEYDEAYKRRYDYYDDPNEDSYGGGGHIDMPSSFPFDFP